MSVDDRTHDTLEECVEDEMWLAEEFQDEYIGEFEDDHHTVLLPVECPVCGREYEYSYLLTNLMHTESQTLVKEF